MVTVTVTARPSGFIGRPAPGRLPPRFFLAIATPFENIVSNHIDLSIELT
jgi:hypothetical protein